MATMKELTQSIIQGAQRIKEPEKEEDKQFVLASLRDMDAALWELIDLIEEDLE